LQNLWAEPEGFETRPPAVRYRIRSTRGKIEEHRTVPTQDPHIGDKWFHALAPQDQLFADRYADLLQHAATYFYAPDEIYQPLEGVADVVVSDEDVRDRIRRIDGGENTREAVRYRGSAEARYPFAELPFEQQRALVEHIEALKREWSFELLGVD
jgi:hypothetical protein